MVVDEDVKGGGGTGSEHLFFLIIVIIFVVVGGIDSLVRNFIPILKALAIRVNNLSGGGSSVQNFVTIAALSSGLTSDGEPVECNNCKLVGSRSVRHRVDNNI